MEVVLKVFDLPELRDRVEVFHDRPHAGEVLAGLLQDFRRGDAIILAIPAGGFPVAAVVAARLGLALDVAVVSKITPSWNSELGYGAVAFDGTVRLNEPLAARLGIATEERRAGIEAARHKVTRRVALLSGGAPPPSLLGRAVILVDDGLATGFTARVAIEALEKLGAKEIFVAVPTAHPEAAARVAGRAAAVYCPNLREAERFAVADAYRRWHDVTDQEIVAMRSQRIRAGGSGESAPRGAGSL